MSKLKEHAITMAKNMLGELPFNTVFSYADNLFDKQEVFFGDASIKAEVDFLKNTKLSDLEYENTDAPGFFTMKNRVTGESIQVSNRESSRGELRGEVLRDHLDKQCQITPDQMAYDTITSAIRTAEYSDMVTMLKGSLSGGGAKLLYPQPMSEDHFALYTKILLARLNEKIATQQIKSDLEPQNIRRNPELMEEVWKGIDAASIFDASQALLVNLQTIKDKADKLSNAGYTTAAKASYTLYDKLTEQKDNFINGKVSVDDFKTNCDQAILEAQSGELKNHRGFFGKVWNAIQTALNVITFGLVSVTPTDSIQKTINTKNAISELVKAAQKSPAPPTPGEVENSSTFTI